MTSAHVMDTHRDQTSLPAILRAALKLGLITSVLVAIFAVLQVRLDGMVELLVCGLIFLVGLAIFITMPGMVTRARTIEGIAGAAGIGLASAGVFLVVDVAAFQPLGLWTNRWLEIGGGSNWWYHPVWWMVSAFIAWMGAWIQANQAAKTGSPNAIALVLGTIVLSLAALALGVLLGVPRAGWNLGSFAVATLPGLALYTLISSFGVPRR